MTAATACRSLLGDQNPPYLVEEFNETFGQPMRNVSAIGHSVVRLVAARAEITSRNYDSI